ncbi:MAG: prepilin-type N-terminal cleavage/methylation domain-containing protein [Bacilli bacterium]|jgi:prepilin-type N-terminal cleavage/methylation domain-containing protein|nr:prepilin-type N-terminal cleavage/methylation domain-containing protein [Bacilli bacterium]MDD3121702.1 prepilin-type N-terminal cleavage/methylation domain-containing protein [Bacilli bacterium]MDD4063655.1 prepilin-type N-terminal cleavage/methylation domain-containing protein [Bacilli bacterium]MDD4482519.1 prepilin-type N-terminal cleavage/methylation domain-containing protein [Bacilli bacterium]MDY0363800.1 prepilin-type N-terminal cleavage/methylation domain-containing protein [Bacilli
MKKYYRKNKNGFSLLESVISILLISIIMTAVLSTILYTNSITKKAEIKMYAINEIDNIVTCFKAEDYTYYEMDGFVNNQELKFSNDYDLINSTEYFYKIVLNVIEIDGGIRSIRATAYNSEDKQIYQMENPYVLGGS